MPLSPPPPGLPPPPPSKKVEAMEENSLLRQAYVLIQVISGLPSQTDPLQRGEIHMDTAKGITAGMQDISMGTARAPWSDDIHMETARGGTTMKQGGFQMWERELLESPEIRRKATVAQLCEW